MSPRISLLRFALAAALAATLAPATTFAQGGTTERIDVPAPAGGVDLPAYTRTVLPNGLTVLLMERGKDPLVHMRLTVRSGSADDPRGREGLASLTAALLTAGTPTRSAEEIAREVDFSGGLLDAAADADGTVVTAEFLSRDARKQMELLADVALRPAFAPGEVERMKRQRLGEIAAVAEDPETYATAQFEAAVFAGTRYAHPAQGTRAAVEAATREEVAAFHGAHYVPNNAVLAIVGSFRQAEMMEMVRAAFGGWRRREVAREAFGAPAAISGRRVAVVDAPGMNQTQVRIGAVGMARSDADYVAVQVANAVLSAGFSSRLTEEIRVNRSLTYGIRSRFNAGARPGSFAVVTFTKNETTREIIDATFAELRKFRDGPIRDDELTRAKNIVLARTTLQLETAGGLAGMISAIETFGLPRDYVERLAPAVQMVTSASVGPLVRRHFDMDDVVILVYTTAERTRAQLEGLGPIETKNFLP